MPRITSSETLAPHTRLILEACEEIDLHRATVAFTNDRLHIYLNEDFIDLDRDFAGIVYAHLHTRLELGDTRVTIVNYDTGPEHLFNAMTAELQAIYDEYTEEDGILPPSAIEAAIMAAFAGAGEEEEEESPEESEPDELYASYDSDGNIIGVVDEHGNTVPISPRILAMLEDSEEDARMDAREMLRAHEEGWRPDEETDEAPRRDYDEMTGIMRPPAAAAAAEDNDDEIREDEMTGIEDDGRATPPDRLTADRGIRIADEGGTVIICNVPPGMHHEMRARCAEHQCILTRDLEAQDRARFFGVLENHRPTGETFLPDELGQEYLRAVQEGDFPSFSAFIEDALKTSYDFDPDGGGFGGGPASGGGGGFFDDGGSGFGY